MDDNGFDTTESSWMLGVHEFVNRKESCSDGFGRTEAYTDGLGRTQACTHAHACNPSPPGEPHKHTCFHVHTQIMPSPSPSEAIHMDEKTSRKRASGNCEAVRRYREKKKAKATSMEEEVTRLTALNEQLMKSQVLLEAENARLKFLLVDFRGRIEGEIGHFPYQNGRYVINQRDMPCIHPQGHELSGWDCGFDSLQCEANQNDV